MKLLPSSPEKEETEHPVSKQQTFMRETDVPLSESIIWRLQREFYVKRGLNAWTQDQVPSFITNNPFFAEIYAGIVFGFAQDCIELGFSLGMPLRILELGAGPGRFSYLFLSHLTALFRSRKLSPRSIRYCMTDCSHSLIEWWRSNRYLAEFVDSGILHFELLDLSGEIRPSFLANQALLGTAAPLVVIANYVFDSLPQDAFVIRHQQICEALVTTEYPSENADKQELSGLQFSFRNVPLPADRYADPSCNHILERYRTGLPAGTVLFPSHALKILQQLSELTNGHLLVLAADKGFAHEDALPLFQGNPTLEFHSPNCFSQIVNFDAIGKYFQAAGGQALLPEKHFSNLSICAFLSGRPGDQYRQTRSAYQETQSAFGVDDLFTLMAWLNAHMEEMSVPQILATLRLTRWDPVAFRRLFPILARELQTVAAEREDLRAAVTKVWKNHYPLIPSENEIAFQCGVVLLGTGFFDDALAMFKTSLRIYGPSAATSYNMGLCFQGLQRQREALACMVEACNLDPNFEPARLSRDKLEKSLPAKPQP